MRVYHLNCGSMSPYFPRTQAIVYCLLVETNDGLVLVDSGFGLKDYSDPTPLMRAFTFLLGVPCDVEETAARQITKLGFAIEDVKHIVLTHLHLDHAGGLPDFADAKVHVFRPEYRAAMDPRGFLGRFYDSAHWAHEPKWVIHDLGGEEWFGFDCIPIVDGLSPRVLLVPLTGHTPGHCGVAVETAEGWLFQCGDAASPFHRETDPHQLTGSHHTANVLPAWFARGVIGPHVPRLRELVRDHGDTVRLISSHDIYSFPSYHGLDRETRLPRPAESRE